MHVATPAHIRCFAPTSWHIRIDTHPDNLVMRALLERLGFQRRGIIHVQEDPDPRIAYERLR